MKINFVTKNITPANSLTRFNVCLKNAGHTNPISQINSDTLSFGKRNEIVIDKKNYKAYCSSDTPITADKITVNTPPNITLEKLNVKGNVVLCGTTKVKNLILHSGDATLCHQSKVENLKTLNCDKKHHVFLNDVAFVENAFLRKTHLTAKRNAKIWTIKGYGYNSMSLCDKVQIQNAALERGKVEMSGHCEMENLSFPVKKGSVTLKDCARLDSVKNADVVRKDQAQISEIIFKPYPHPNS